MFEITKTNCYKCDLETIIANDSQYILKLRPNVTGKIFLISMKIHQL